MDYPAVRNGPQNRSMRMFPERHPDVTIGGLVLARPHLCNRLFPEAQSSNILARLYIQSDMALAPVGALAALVFLSTISNWRSAANFQ
jgi:hypothetical protein